MTQLRGTWMATVLGVNAVYEGELSVPVADGTWNFSNGVEELLRQDENVGPDADDLED